MDLERRIQAFSELGNRIKNITSDVFETWAVQAGASNNWFTRENVKTALDGLALVLEKKKLNEWISAYKTSRTTSRKVGVVMAGNIPCVGFHDMLCVLVSGHILYAKLSSQDSALVKNIAKALIEIEPGFAERIIFADRLNNIDAVIATGSDNSARHFKFYFGKMPHIIRQNRTSAAVLNGQESEQELGLLGKDILQYFGLGCRNVSKLYVPEDYSFTHFFQSIEYLKPISQHHKYLNNYDYNKSIFLINRVEHFDNGFLMLRESESLFSPISVVHFERYSGIGDLQARLGKWHEKIQILVGSHQIIPEAVTFGQAQCPTVMDYADGVDTMEFLLNL
ncbi:MAG TPA: hypothetical protein VNW99_07720 [Cytophagaceae bacterium]|jgi:hypothetical protein|nr:hypothetical protein [Cytophagaceae bacterium]